MSSYNLINFLLLFRETKNMVENKLNSIYSGWNYNLSTYDNISIKLSIRNIQVKPYITNPQKVINDEQYDYNRFHIHKRVRSFVLNNWMSYVSIDIPQNINFKSIRPEGLLYKMASTGQKYQYYDNIPRSNQIRIDKTNPMKSNKLIFKVKYVGDISKYKERFHNTIDQFQFFHNNIYAVTLRQLQYLDDNNEFNNDRETVLKLGKFLYDKDFENITPIRNRIRNEEVPKYLND